MNPKKLDSKELFRGIFNQQFNYRIPILLTARLITGFGFGLIIGISGAQTMRWFPPGEQSIINTINSVIGSLGMSIAYMITVPLYQILGTWQRVFFLYFLYAGIMILTQVIFGRDKTESLVLSKVEVPQHNKNGIFQALEHKEVIIFIFTF